MNRVLVFVMYVKSIAVNAAIKAVSLSLSIVRMNIFTQTHTFTAYTCMRVCVSKWTISIWIFYFVFKFYILLRDVCCVCTFIFVHRHKCAQRILYELSPFPIWISIDLRRDRQQYKDTHRERKKN